MEFKNSGTEEQSVYLFLGNTTIKNCSPCIVNKVKVYNSRNSGKIFYSTDEISFDEGIKFSIFRDHNIIKYYVNEFFIHAMEFDLIDGHEIKTNYFEDSLAMDVKILYD